MKKIFALLFVLIFTSTSSISLAAVPVDADMQKVLNELQAKKSKPIETLSAAEARRQPTPADAVKTLMKKQKIKNEVKVEARDIKIEGAVGPLTARIYTPQGKKNNLPIVLYFPGGGFVIANRNVYDATPKSLTAQTEAIFVSVDYRRGPENKFPAAHDDAFAAYKWILKNAASFNGDPKDVAVAGESAGGNLALNVAIMARDQKIQMPKHALLVYPVAGTDMNTESYIENAAAKPLNKPMMEWFVKNYTTNPAEASDTRLNLLAANLSSLPSVTIITAQIDPLRSEGEALANKLKAAGVSVEYKNYEGVTHEFFGMAAVVQDAKDAQQFAANNLKQSLER